MYMFILERKKGEIKDKKEKNGEKMRLKGRHAVDF